MKQRYHLGVVSIAALLLLSGCASYKSAPLKRLNRSKVAKSDKQTISFEHHTFTKKDCKKYLDRDVLARGYQPVQITFTNNTDHSFFFSPTAFSFSYADWQEVAHKVHTNTAVRIGLYSAAGVASIPFAWLSACTCIMLSAGLAASAATGPMLLVPTLGLIAAGLVPLPFFTAAGVDGCRSSQANALLDADYERKALGDHVVRPWSCLNGLIFVPQEVFSPHFAFTVLDMKTNERYMLSTHKPAFALESEMVFVR